VCFYVCVQVFMWVCESPKGWLICL
jgi:hypothetical protein